MSRKSLMRSLKEKQKELRGVVEALDRLARQMKPLLEKENSLLDEIRPICNQLGLESAKECPSFRMTTEVSSCLIEGWRDNSRTARFCINCPISLEEARIRVMMCKIKGERKVEE